MTDYEIDDDDIEYLPSKSAVKRELHALQKLGEDVAALKIEEIEQLGLPSDLHEALLAAKKMKQGPGLKRQRQYVGKLIRSLDSDAIRREYEKIRHLHDTNTASFKRLESLRDRMVAGDHDAITEAIDRYPEIDRQHLNQLVRQAVSEQKREKPPTASRKLFRYLRDFEEQG